MSLDPGLSRDEKEKLLNQKMESIRRKNEELRRRHQEIEADKKNADKLSSTVTMDAVKPYVMKVPRTRPEKSDRTREVLDQPPPPRPADIMPARQRLTEVYLEKFGGLGEISGVKMQLPDMASDGPPPDPSYRFLSDPDRDGIGGGRDNRKEQRGRSGKGRGKYGGKGIGGGAWEGSVVDGGREGTSERGGRGGGRGTRGGYNLSRGEDDIIPDITLADEEFRGQGGRGSNRGRGRGRSIGNSDKFDGEQGHEFGGRGRGMGNGRAKQESENYQTGDVTNISPSGNSRGEGGGKGRFSFASRDIRYYPDDNVDYGNERHGRARGRGNYGQHSFENYDGNRRLRERGRGRGSFEHRGRGRGLGQHYEYEKWKAEREAIDEARVTRGRTNEGTWRREWDNDKLEQGEMDDSEPIYDPRYPRSKDEGIKLGDFVTLPCSDDRVSSQPQAGHHRGQQGDYRPIGNRGSQGNYRSQGYSIDPELNGKFVRVGSGRMVKPALQTCQTEQGVDEVKSWGGDKQHHRGRGNGKKNQRGRGSGQGQGRANITNDENFQNSPSIWIRSAGGDIEGAPISSFNESSQSHLEVTSVSSNFISSVQCPKKYNKVQESSNPPGQVTNLPPSDIPADDSSWTGATSGNESLDTSGLSQEGICLGVNQDDEDAPVEEPQLGVQCVNSELNASDDEIEKHIDTNATDDEIEKHIDTNASDDEIEKHIDTNASDDEIEKHTDTNASDDETEKHIDTNASDDEIEKHIDTNASDDEIEKHIDAKNDEDQEGEYCKNYEDFKERKDTEKNYNFDVLTACSVSEDDKVSKTESETLVVSKIMEPVCSNQKKEESTESMIQAPADGLKIQSKIDVVAEDCIKLDPTSSVENKYDTDGIEFQKEHCEENNMSKRETITETENKMNMATDALEDPDTLEDADVKTTEDKPVCGIGEVIQEESTQKAAAVNHQKILMEKANHENKMPEICLTPASPIKTEQLVPNIEWK